MSKIKIGDIIEGCVTGIEKYGIFVNLDEFYNGLIHISEISGDFVRDVNDYVKIGETIYAKVIDVDEDTLQIKLSIKDINYKHDKGFPKPEESETGFKPLAENLEKWTEEKLEEYAENEKTD